MTPEDLIELFRQHLRKCARKHAKYRDRFTVRDEEQAVRILHLVLEHPDLPAEHVLDQLTKEASA